MLTPSVATICDSFLNLHFAKVSVKFALLILFVYLAFALLHFLLKIMVERLCHWKMLVSTTASFHD